jgi:hypothetical protein
MNLPAARNAVRNTLTRSPLHTKWFLNDPDCLLLRPTTKLTPAELQVCATGGLQGLQELLGLLGFSGFSGFWVCTRVECVGECSNTCFEINTLCVYSKI